MFGMHSIKFRVLTKFKSSRLLELNGRMVSKSYKFHGTITNPNCLLGNQSHDVFLKPKFKLLKTEYPWIRTYSGHRIFLTYGIFNLIDKRTTEKQAEFLLNIKVQGTLQLKRYQSGDCKNNSEDGKPKATCVKKNLVNEFIPFNEKSIYPDDNKEPEKVKGVNKRKCGETPEELRKCLKTFQDVLDFVHPIVPYVS